MTYLQFIIPERSNGDKKRAHSECEVNNSIDPSIDFQEFDFFGSDIFDSFHKWQLPCIQFQYFNSS